MRCQPGRRQDGWVIRVGGYHSAPDARAASWVAAGVYGFFESVLSFVPAGFEAYARIFHSAWRWDPDIPVSWQEVAQANGRIAVVIVARRAHGTGR
jgi:hypothetical protein